LHLYAKLPYRRILQYLRVSKYAIIFFNTKFHGIRKQMRIRVQNKTDQRQHWINNPDMTDETLLNLVLQHKPEGR